MGSRIVFLGDFQDLFGMQGEGGWSIIMKNEETSFLDGPIPTFLPSGGRPIKETKFAH